MIPIVPPRIDAYCLAHTTPADPLLDELAAYTHAHCKFPQMLTGPVEGTFLRMLVQVSAAKRVLEIGTFTGYSALSMAAGLPDDGELITCDIDPETNAIAQSFWAAVHMEEESSHNLDQRWKPLPRCRPIPFLTLCLSMPTRKTTDVQPRQT